MTADKTEVTAKKIATSNAPSKVNKAAKSAVKTTSKKTGVLPKLAVKKTKKEPKEKVIRDSFSLPKTEHLKIAEIKEACLKAGLHVRKNEILRAGLKALGELSQLKLEAALAGLGKVKAAHPKKL